MISQRMKERRQQLRKSLQTQSDAEEPSTSSQTPMIPLQPLNRTEQIDNESEDMLEALQTRRTQRFAEMNEIDHSDRIASPPQVPSADLSFDEGHSRTQSAASSNLNLSIRERLRSRVKSSASDTSQNRKLRGLRGRALPNRFDDSKSFAAVEEELNPYLQESIATTKEWKRLKIKKDTETTGLVTEEEAFQFFVGGLDEEKDEEIDTNVPPVESAVVLEMEDEHLIYNAKPIYRTTKERQEIENRMYHYPSSIPAPSEMKVPPGTVPRNLEDEGFYVGNTPTVSRATLSKMEHRILAADKNSGWFNEDGNLKRQPNPLKEQSVRQVLIDELDVDPMLQLDWQKAQPSLLDTRYIDEQGKKHYQIDVDISEIRFTHQSLFSREHVLESRLIQLYRHFVLRQKSGVQEHLEHKLEALRTSLQQLKNESENIEQKQSKMLSREHNKRIKSVLLEMRDLYLLKENEEVRERALLLNILQTWQKMKKLREAQEYTNTSSCLKVRKELSNKASDEQKYQREVDERIESERQYFSEQHKDEFAEYHTKLTQWKKYRKHLKKKLQNADNKDNEKELVAVEKPEPPPSFDEDVARREIRQKIMKTRRKAGEAYLIPELQSGAVITPTEKCPRPEQVRRASMKGVKYFVKVLFNDLEVSRTASRTLSTEFVVQFGEILGIKILQWPESIKLQIYDASSTTLVAELFAPIPELNAFTTSQDVSNFEHLEFSSDQIIQYRHEGVGSGVPIDLSFGDLQEAPLIPLTSGVLYVATHWGVDSDGKPIIPSANFDNVNTSYSVARHYDALAALGAAGMIDLQKLLSWINHVKLDPNDPTNADIINLIKMAQMSHLEDISGPGFFRLNQLEEESEFSTNQELDENKRFRLIKLRDSGVPELKHFQMIPPDQALISDEVFEEYEKRINFIDMDDGEEYSQRKAVARFVTKVREQVHTRSQLAKRQLDLEDMIVEEDIPDIGTLGARLVQMTEPRRPLKPVRKERKKIGGQNLAALKDVHILINIVRAFDIPVRIDSGSSADQLQQSGYNVATAEVKSLVRPFIEVMFQGNFLRTSVADGAYPNWNEDLLMPFKPPNNDYTTDSLQLVKDKIYINLFDEFLVDMLADERLRPTNIHQRIEKRWLGSIEVPFSTVYFNSKVDGFLEVDSPPILLGYKRSENKPASLQLIRERTLIQTFITIEPQLQPAPPMPEKFETNEDEALIHNSQIWLSELRKKFPKLEYKTMVTDIDGKKVFLTRYIYPQKPPEELILNQDIPDLQKMKLLARFVSLIPYIADSAQFPDLCDIWATSDQFLQMLAGDEEEHAVLLCNYFLWLGKKAFVVLGHGVPEGSTAYVLSEDGSSFRLWNASSGDQYEIQDVHSPLQNIGCLVDASNIYGNIQGEDHPSKLVFNVNNTKCWRPFFSKSFLNPGLASVQLEAPVYLPVDTQFALDLQDKLERILRDKLMEWRPRYITKFNRYCTQVFKNLLQTIESKIVLSGMSTNEHRNELRQVLASHQLTGFPLHMPYTSTEDVVERVFSTGVHKSEDADIEFALAVHVHPYPNSVLAVWIYIGSLLRKSS